MLTRSCNRCSTKNRSKARYCTKCGEEFKGVCIFFSYAHKDEALRDEVANHLSLLKHQGFVTLWHDRNINAGNDWSTHIDQHLQNAEIILLLVSSAFMASDYCYSFEMQRAMERWDYQEALVIPIILRPVDWHSAPFGKIQALPKDAVPVTSWPNQDQALLDIAARIRKAIKDSYYTP